jgi:hypothetical protein
VTFAEGEERREESGRSQVYYTFQYARDEDFTVGLVTADSLEDSTYTPVYMQDNTYYWRVRGFDAAGYVGDWPSRGWVLVIDNEEPDIDSTTLWTDTSYSGPFEIETWAMDDYGLSGVFVYHRIGDTPDWTDVEMESQGGNWWSGEIPELVGYDENTTVRYYIRAIDLADPSNESTDPAGAPSSYYEFLVYDIEEGASSKTPESFDLFPVNPNPAMGRMSIGYAVPKDCVVSLRVFDAAGKHVSTVFDGTRTAGYYEVHLNGRTMSQGVYFIRLEAGGFVKTRRMMVVR